MSRLFLVRHGQASFLEQNYDRLSKLGEAQSLLLGEYWTKRKLLLDCVYTGPRTRQRETATIVGAAYQKAGLPWPEVQVMQEFDEYSGESVMDASLPALAESEPRIQQLRHAFLGAVSQADKHKTFQRLFEAVISKWAAGELKVENVESWAEFCARVQRGLQSIAARHGGGKNVAVFSSGGPVGVTLQRALGLSPGSTLQAAWMARNCSFSEFLFSGERFTLSSFNEVPHLNDPAYLTYR